MEKAGHGGQGRPSELQRFQEVGGGLVSNKRCAMCEKGAEVEVDQRLQQREPKERSQKRFCNERLDKVL